MHMCLQFKLKAIEHSYASIRNDLIFVLNVPNKLGCFSWTSTIKMTENANKNNWHEHCYSSISRVVFSCYCHILMSFWCWTAITQITYFVVIGFIFRLSRCTKPRIKKNECHPNASNTFWLFVCFSLGSICLFVQLCLWEM